MTYLHEHATSLSVPAAASGHAGQHGLAIVGLLYLPVVIMIFLGAMNHAAVSGLAGGRRFMAGFASTPPPARLALLLMAASASVHLSLVPVHGDEPVTALLFCLDGAALLGLAGVAFVFPRWRVLAGALLVANLAAYALYVGLRWEKIDQVGIATKAVELAALALVVIQPARSYVWTIRNSVAR